VTSIYISGSKNRLASLWLSIHLFASSHSNKSTSYSAKLRHQQLKKHTSGRKFQNGGGGGFLLHARAAPAMTSNWSCWLASELPQVVKQNNRRLQPVVAPKNIRRRGPEPWSPAIQEGDAALACLGTTPPDVGWGRHRRCTG